MAGDPIIAGVGAGDPHGLGMTPGGAARDGTITTTTGIRPMPNAAREAATLLTADGAAPTVVWLMAAGVAHHGLLPHGALPDAALRSALRSAARPTAPRVPSATPGHRSPQVPSTAQRTRSARNSPPRVPLALLATLTAEAPTAALPNAVPPAVRAVSVPPPRSAVLPAAASAAEQRAAEAAASVAEADAAAVAGKRTISLFSTSSADGNEAARLLPVPTGFLPFIKSTKQ